jgi:tetratricopeptide (TPR) repeat protein
MNANIDRSEFEHYAALAEFGILFDDEPLEAILYGAPSSGPSSADLFAAAEQTLGAVHAALEQDDLPGALRRMAQLLESDSPVPERVLLRIAGFMRQLVPDVPCPLIEDQGPAYGRILQPCFDAGGARRNDALVKLAGAPLYRWYEAVGRYEAAAEVVRRMLEDAAQRRDTHAQAQLTNNLGYEYLLSQRWEEAAPYFQRSTALFEALGDAVEVANGRANALLCEAGLKGPEQLSQSRSELNELATTLRRRHDWRARKPLGLIARIEEQKGHCRKAILYARAAVIAGREVPSRHHLEDQEYLAGLEARCGGARRRR